MQSLFCTVVAAIYSVESALNRQTSLELDNQSLWHLLFLHKLVQQAQEFEFARRWRPLS